MRLTTTPSPGVLVLLLGSLLGISFHNAVASTAGGVSTFYPDGHFDRVAKMTDYDAMLQYVDEQIHQHGKTVFARFIASEK